MPSDLILEEKWRVQRQMAKESNYDIETLFRRIQEDIPDIEHKYNVKFKPAKLVGKYQSANTPPSCGF